MSLWLLYLVVIIQAPRLFQCLGTAEAGTSPSDDASPSGGQGEVSASPPSPHEINSHTITASDFAGAVIGQQQQQSESQQPALTDQLLPAAASIPDGPPKGDQQLLPSALRKLGDVNADVLPVPVTAGIISPALTSSELTESSASPVPAPSSPTITVEEVVPGPQLNQQPSSSGEHSEPQDTVHPTNADGSSKGSGDTSPTDISSVNKQANPVQSTVDKGGGNSAADEISMKPLHSLEEIRQIPLSELYSKITNEIKQYRDYVSTAWESERLVSWTIEATSYLKDYMEAISISETVHNSYKCVEKDLKNHEARSKAIENIIESCRSELKRESWYALEEQTSYVLSSFDKIVQNASNIIDMLNKESELFDVVKSAVEDYAKNSLCLIDTQSLRKSLSDLKESSMRTDREEYVKCVDSKPERSMIKDTMSDIMRIKNNCVG